MRSPISYTVALVSEARERAIFHVVIEQPTVHQTYVSTSNKWQGPDKFNKNAFPPKTNLQRAGDKIDPCGIPVVCR